MFDKLLRTLKQFEEPQKLSVPMKIESDADGYIDKQCPSEVCGFSFKVGEEDWRDKVRDEEVFCPSCGHIAPATDWYTTEQVEWAKQAAFAKFKGLISDAMRQDASSWNKRVDVIIPTIAGTIDADIQKLLDKKQSMIEEVLAARLSAGSDEPEKPSAPKAGLSLSKPPAPN